MSETETFWFKLSEKALGLLLVALSLLMIYLTIISSSNLGAFSGFFGFLSIVPIIAGVLLLIVKPPE